jgi:hypothetical protein
MTFKSIEIHYDIDRIPGIAGGAPAGRSVVPFARMRPPRGPADTALAFRNDAIELIEEALLAAGAGEWEGAEIGRGQVSFGFAVDDFDVAEAIVKQTVAGTPFAGFREIVRREFDMADLV